MTQIIDSKLLLEIITNTTQDAIVIMDEKGNIIFWNKASENIFGYSKEEILGKNLHFLLAPVKYKEKYILGLENFKKTGNGKSIDQVVEIEGITKNGFEITLKLSLAAVEVDGKFNALGIMRDITDLKEIDNKLNNLLIEKSILLKEVHHRVKNNMNTVISLISLQLETIKNKEAESILNDTVARIHGMMILYDKMFKSEDYNSISLKEYFHSLIDEFSQHFFVGDTIKIEEDLDDFVINIKKAQILGIILNEFLTNIIKHAYKNGEEKYIFISAKKEEKELIIIIQDNGKGLPKDIDLKKSTGFGFMAIDNLSGQLGGTFKIDNSVVKGTKLILTFPHI